MNTADKSAVSDTRKKVYLVLGVLNAVALFIFIAFLSCKPETAFFNYAFAAISVLFVLNAVSFACNRAKWVGLVGLLFYAAAALGICFSNLLISVMPRVSLTRSVYSIVLIFMLFGYEGFSAYTEIFSLPKLFPVKRTTAIVLSAFCGALLIVGVVFAVGIFYSPAVGDLSFQLSQNAIYFAFAFLCAGLALCRLLTLVAEKYAVIPAAAITLFVCVTLALPFLSTPANLKDARDAYVSVYGEPLRADGMKRLPVDIGAVFTGIATEKYDARFDVLYYESDLAKLRFDAYYPTDAQPGDAYPTLVRIHGGGWSSGDKGMQNAAQYNKYFASKGYAVFDIQYGLYSNTRKDEVYGRWNTRNMLEQIGSFFAYLTKNAAEFFADLDNVFISGGSAGGQLCMAAGLAMGKEQYADIFPVTVGLRGLIPFYPAFWDNVFPDMLDRELQSTLGLVDANSVPALVFIGKSDSLYSHSMKLKDAYDAQGAKCAVLPFAFAGHNGDNNFYAPCTQIFVYYMESFMASRVAYPAP